jgi:hypothetical protein
MRVTGGHPDAHDDEVEEVGWFAPAEATKALAFKSERDILAAVLREQGDAL